MFELFARLNVEKNNSLQLITGLKNPDVLIVLSNNLTFQSGSLIQRSYNSGKVFRVRWMQNSVRGNFYSLSYGSHEVLFDIPSPLEPFDLEIIPGRYQFTYAIEVFQRAYNPAFNVLAEKLGISLELLQFIPQSTLQILSGINLMTSSDTRNLIQSIEATSVTIAADKAAQDALNATNATAIAAAQTAAQTAQTAANTNASGIQSALGVIAATASEMVRKFTRPVLATEFRVDDDGFYKATVTHNLGDKTPDIEVFDAQGEKQLVQSIARGRNNIELELTSSNMTDNSWPLQVIVMGKFDPSVQNGFARLGARESYYKLEGGFLLWSLDGVENNGILSPGVAAAYMLTATNLVYAKLNDNTCISFEGLNPSTPTTITAATFNSGLSNADRIAL